MRCSPLGHDTVAVHRCPEADVDAPNSVDVAKDQQHGAGHGLEHLHDFIKVVDRHVPHVGSLLSTQDVGQAKVVHVDRSLQQHLTEDEVVCM